MSSFIGADPEQLDLLAQRFVNASQALQNIRGGITNALMTAQWDGQEADRFRTDWSSQLGPSLLRAATSLGSCSSYLKTKAAEQIQASAAGADGAGSFNLAAFLRELVKSPAFINAETGLGYLLGFLGIANPIMGQDQKMIQAEQGRSPAQQAAWWSSLSSAQQNQLETLAPASLLTLAGLPSSVRQQLSNTLVDGMKGSIPAQTTTINASVQGGELWVAGANLQFVQTKEADGSVQVTLSGKLSGGVGVQWDGGAAGASISSTLGVGDSATYTFSSMAQAQAFEQGLIQSATPQLGWQDLGLLVPGAGPAAVVASQVANYLSGYGNQMTSNVVSGSLTNSASVNIGAPGLTDGVAASIQEGKSISYDTVQGTTTATISASGSVSAQLAPFAGAASGNVSAAVTWNKDNQMTDLTLSGNYSASGTDSDLQGLGNPVGAGLPPNVDGTNGNFKMTVDLTNPANAAAAAKLITDLQTGNASGVSQAYQELYDNSTVLVEKGTSGGPMPVTVGVGVVSGSYSDSNVNYNNIYVKPPNGDYVQVKPQ